MQLSVFKVTDVFQYLAADFYHYFFVIRGSQVRISYRRPIIMSNTFHRFLQPFEKVHYRFCSNIFQSITYNYPYRCCINDLKKASLNDSIFSKCEGKQAPTNFAVLIQNVPGLNPGSGNSLSWNVSVVILRYFSNLFWYLKIGCGLFLAYPFQFIILSLNAK